MGVQRRGCETLLEAFGILVRTAINVSPPGWQDEEPLHVMLPAVLGWFPSCSLPKCQMRRCRRWPRSSAACVGLPPYGSCTATPYRFDALADRHGFVVFHRDRHESGGTTAAGTALDRWHCVSVRLPV